MTNIIKSASMGRFLVSLAMLAGLFFAFAPPDVYSRGGEAGKFLRLDFVPGTIEGSSNEQHGRYILSFNGQINARICKESTIPLFYADILGARIDSNPFLMNFERGPVKMARLTQISDDPAVLRATFFLRRPLSPNVKSLKNSIEIFFTEPGEKQTDEKRTSYSLIEPEKKAIKPFVLNQTLPKPEPQKGSSNEDPMRIKLANSDSASILRELARQAGQTIHFRDAVQSRIELDISATDPGEAMRQVAEKIGYALTIEDGDIWVSRLENPLLRISETDQVQGADLSNLALGDVLRALGQIAEVNIGLDKSMESVKERKVNIYFQKISVRRAFETLLKVHDLVLTIVDEKTLLVMTLENARQIEGKVVRIMSLQVPYEKLTTVVAQTISSDIIARVKTQEDLGNLILTGDKEAVDIYETAVKSLEGKMLHAGESFSREYFHPLNTKPEDLIAMANENIDKTENIKISHDKRTDMLLVSGPASPVARAIEMIKKLDFDPTRQALIHIRLVEIHRKDLDTMGIRFPDQLVSTDDVANFSASSIVIPAAFTAFQDSNRIKTLANPTLRCMDKEEASIDISEQIPVKSTVTNYFAAAAASMSVNTSDNWTTSEVGIKLNIQPFIHKDNEITMKVDVDLTELLSLVEGHPWTAKRNIKTMVRVKNNETVVIGGLIRNKKTTNKRPIPLLSRIPILRRLLKRIEHTEDTDEKSEMVILITPNVVNSAGAIIPAIHESKDLALMQTKK